jgi:hypothetical protein
MNPAMKIVLRRGFSDKRVTLGLLQIEGVEHDPIFTLENPQRDTNLDNRIPAGTYKVVPHQSPSKGACWKVLDVVGRADILIHSGNTEAQTLGCILIGLSAGTLVVADKDGAIVKREPRCNNSIEAIRYFRQLTSNNEFTLVIE